MPSQDLASWVAGRSEKPDENRDFQDDGKSIPPLKRLPHLPLGEISPDSTRANGSFYYLPLSQGPPFTKAFVTVPGGSVKSETQSINTQATTLSSSSTLVADDDPDMLVLGFQELDLSTEALLYSTGTTREDAWSMAVFAGLGEKGVLYEKVRCSRCFDPNDSVETCADSALLVNVLFS
jgi:phosphatidylinositol-bisphosphatase